MNRLVVTTIAAAALALPLAAGCSSSSGSDESVVDPEKLDAPPHGEGFQLKTDLFSVAPGEEVQACYFFKVRDLARAGGLDENQPVNLHRIQAVQRKGSHHMNLFRVRTIVKDADGKPLLSPENGPVEVSKNGQGSCFKSPLWADWPLVANSQQEGNFDWTFPDGVVNVFQPDEWLMLQTHYVNATTQATPAGGEVAINAYTIPKDQVKAEMGTIFATKQSIRVCKSNPTPTFSGTCQIRSKEPVNIIGANGHFHGRGKKFEIFSWDGTSIDRPSDAARFYESDSWDEPPMMRSPDLDVAVQPGSGIFFSCSYQWQPPSEEAGGCAKLDQEDKAKNKDATPDCCYTFGGIVETNEHCNAFVYYWPKQDDVFCN